MVEELLQTLVGVVDAQLLERVVLKFNTVVDRNTTSRTTVHQEISLVPSQFNRSAVVLLKILFVIVVRLKARNWAFILIYQWRNSKNILHFYAATSVATVHIYQYHTYTMFQGNHVQLAMPT